MLILYDILDRKIEKYPYEKNIYNPASLPVRLFRAIMKGASDPAEHLRQLGSWRR
jgi:hypothetical protein